MGIFRFLHRFFSGKKSRFKKRRKSVRIAKDGTVFRDATGIDGNVVIERRVAKGRKRSRKPSIGHGRNHPGHRMNKVDKEQQ